MDGWIDRSICVCVYVPEDVDCSSARSEEEELSRVVPRHLVHLVRELHVLERLALSRLDQRDVILGGGGTYLAFTRYCYYQYQYCILNETHWGVGGNPYIAQSGWQHTEGAMQEVFSAKNSID